MPILRLARKLGEFRTCGFRDMQADRQTNKQTERQTGRRTAHNTADRQTNIQTDRQTHCSQYSRQIDRQIDRQTDTLLTIQQTDRQTYWQTDILLTIQQTDRQTYRQRDTLLTIPQNPTHSWSHLSSIDVIYNQVEFVGRLERVVKTDKERMMDITYEHISLRHHMTYLVLLHHVRFAQHFDCIQLLFRLVTRK